MKHIFKPIALLVILFAFNTQITIAQKRYPTKAWYASLPLCPCRNPDFDSVKYHDGWAKDKANLNKYHRGAVASYRSYPPVKTEEGWSCQQCCYDYYGNLITSGRAAGTPDKVSACSGENKNGVMTFRFFGLIGHYIKDVRPWIRLMKVDSSGWQQYNALWLPDRGNGCPLNMK